MMRIRIVAAAMLCCLLAACAFGSYKALIPSEAVVLPLGTASSAATYIQNADDPARWDKVTADGGPESFDIRQEGYGYWLDSDSWLVFAQLDGSADEYLMQVALPDEAIEGGYVYSYAVGKLVGSKLYVKIPDCDDLSIDTMNALGLDAECEISSYADLQRVIAETKDAAGYSTYYLLR